MTGHLTNQPENVDKRNSHGDVIVDTTGFTIDKESGQVFDAQGSYVGTVNSPSDVPEGTAVQFSGPVCIRCE